MTDQAQDGASIRFDAVVQGPIASDDHETASAPHPQVQSGNPSVDALRATFGDSILRNEVCAGDQDVVYVGADRITEILGWLHQDPDQHYDHLADVTAVDYGGGRPLEVVYQLWSIPHKRALRVKCELPLDHLEVDTVTGIWVGANWLEREVYDLFGIRFTGHPDLRRILMPETYAEGHPLRKDFPLRGRFSRAEQTRRALSQEPVDFYTEAEMGEREPQLVDSGGDASNTPGGGGGTEHGQ